VVFFWVGNAGPVELAIVPVLSGEATTSFVVPVDTTPGSHAVLASCTSDATLVAEAAFLTIPTPPAAPPAAPTPHSAPAPRPPERAIVPNLLGLSTDEAAAELKDAGLVLGSVSGSGDRVVAQDPRPGAEALIRSSVDISMSTPAAGFVVVPNVLGLTLPEAKDALESVGLALGDVSGAGDSVGEQSFDPGTRVPSGASVDLTMQLDPPPNIVVPELIGLSEQGARKELARLGLRLVVSNASTGTTIDSQVPSPGTLVRPGSVVTVITSAPPMPSPTIPGLILVLLALVVAAVGIPLLRRWHNAVQREWVASHVRARPVTPIQVSSSFVATPGESEGPRPVTRIEPHPGARHHEFEEVRA
jgi:hypothetical protein